MQGSRPAKMKEAAAANSNSTATCACSHWLRPSEHGGPIDQLKLEKDARGNVKVNDNYATNVPASSPRRHAPRAKPGRLGHQRRRCAAKCVDEFLMGASDLPFLKLFWTPPKGSNVLELLLWNSLFLN